MVETADKGLGSIRNGIIRLFVSEILCSPRRNSFERFLHYCSKVLGVVQSTECFVLKCETACRFSTCVVRSVKSSTRSMNKGFIELIFSISLFIPFRNRVRESWVFLETVPIVLDHLFLLTNCSLRADVSYRRLHAG